MVVGQLIIKGLCSRNGEIKLFCQALAVLKPIKTHIYSSSSTVFRGIIRQKQANAITCLNLKIGRFPMDANGHELSGLSKTKSGVHFSSTELLGSLGIGQSDYVQRCLQFPSTAKPLWSNFRVIIITLGVAKTTRLSWFIVFFFKLSQ